MMRLRETTRFLDEDSVARAMMVQAAMVLPGGITREEAGGHPVAPVMAAGYGATLIDADNDERVDFLLNDGALIHGHAWEGITEAVSRQAARLTGAPFPTGAEAELAWLLAGRVPVEGPLVRFTSTGAEAVLLALRLAAVATRRRKVVVMEYCDHGSFVPTSKGAYPPREYLLCPFNAPALLRQLFEQNRDRIGAVLVDLCPVRGALSPASESFIAEIGDCCAEYGALLILDEVMSSRAAPGGLAARSGLRPDMVCLGGWIGGGLPAGAVAMRPELGRYFGAGDWPRLGHDSTFSGNPVSMAAGLAAVGGLGPGREKELEAATAALCEELSRVFARRRSSWAVRRAGSMFCLWPHPDLPISPSLASHHMTRRKIAGISDWLLRHGVVLGESGFGCVSTATKSAEMEYLVTAVDAYLAAV